MNNQLSFSASEYARKKKATRRESFLGEMEKVVPWGRLIALIEPCYPKGGAREATDRDREDAEDLLPCAVVRTG